MSRRHALSLSLPGGRGRRYVAKSSMYLLPMCVLFFCIARCASAGEAKVTHASPVARPSLCPRTMPVGLNVENPQLWGGLRRAPEATVSFLSAQAALWGA